jgi:hypothetical protein
MGQPVDFTDLPIRAQELAFRHWIEGAIGKSIVWRAESTGGGPPQWHCTAGILHSVEATDIDGRLEKMLDLNIDVGLIKIPARGITPHGDFYSYALTGDELGCSEGQYEWNSFAHWIDSELSLEPI